MTAVADRLLPVADAFDLPMAVKHVHSRFNNSAK